MQLPGARPEPPTGGGVADALRSAAARLGHRPAVTVLRGDLRDEQGFASLYKWAAKGANLLEIEAATEPGDGLRLDAPPGWLAAAVALAAWWSGLHLTDGDAAVAVTDDAILAGVDRVYGVTAASSDLEPWAEAVQTFPDEPPAPRGAADSLAVVVGELRWTQDELLAEAQRWGTAGALGLRPGTPTAAVLAAFARPLVTGLPTVVVDGASPEQIARERVSVWI